MRVDLPPAPLPPTLTSVAPAQSSSAASMEVRREPGLTYSYVARDAQGQELWRFPRESILKIYSLSEKSPGALVNIKT